MEIEFLQKQTNVSIEEPIREVQIIQNGDSLYKSDIKWIEPKEKPDEINEFEKNLIKNTKNPDQLLESEKEEVKTELTEEQKEIIKRKEYITKVKVISLDKMGKHPLMNPSYFSLREKKTLMTIMEETMKKTDEEILLLFNEICNERIFHPTADYSSYPVYKELV
jgi:hypothetical protein